jgi:heat shock protein HslJ
VLRRSLALLAVLVVAGSVLTACGSDDGGGGRGSGGSSSGGSGGKAQPLEGTEWILDQEASGLTPVPAAVVTAQFSSDGRLTGNAGCNNYSTSYEADGSDLTIAGPIAQNLMACAGPVMRVEGSYLARLPKAKSFAIRGRTLTITTSAAALVYRALDPEQALAGDWVVINYFRPGAVTSPVPGSTLTANFESGTISGDAGCNQYSGPYETDGTKIAIGPVASTLRACADPAVGEQESQYLAALALARTFSLAGGNLTLFRDGGTIAVTYQRG